MTNTPGWPAGDPGLAGSFRNFCSTYYSNIAPQNIVFLDIRPSLKNFVPHTL
jgi:hypothetical protein